MADHIRTQLALGALEMAVGRRKPERGLIIIVTAAVSTRRMNTDPRWFGMGFRPQ